MKKMKKQFRGYKIKEVNAYVGELENEIQSLNQQIASLQNNLETLSKEKEDLLKQMDVAEKTNEEIARLALKEASHLIEKAKRNANMILKELEYRADNK